jgi:1-phosphofructokinase family hexose kinase
VQRSAKTIVQPGGKGSNVARICRQLNDEIVLLGFVGRANASLVTQPLRRIGVEVDVVEAFDGPSRTCTIIIDPATKSHPTVINEESPGVEPTTADRLVATARKWMAKAQAVLVTGSLPQGLDAAFYRRILEQAQQRALFTAVDAVGEPLSQAIQIRPSFLKLNAQEFADHVGLKTRQMADIVDYLKAHGNQLCEQLVVTFAEVGALLKTATTFLWAKPPEIFHANPIGSGDAFAAGYLHEILVTSSVERAFSFGMACAASEAATVAQGQIDPAPVRSFLKAIKLIRL